MYLVAFLRDTLKSVFLVKVDCIEGGTYSWKYRVCELYIINENLYWKGCKLLLCRYLDFLVVFVKLRICKYILRGIVRLREKTKIFDQKNEIEAWKNEKKRKFVRGKARFVGPTYSALSLRSSFHKKAPVNRE